MASATTRLAFSFHHHYSTTSLPHAKPKTYLLLLLPLPLPLQPIPTTRNCSSSSFSISSLQRTNPILNVTTKSIDVSKEDKPTTSTTTTTSSEEESSIPIVSEEDREEDDIGDFTGAPRRPAERFAVLNTGIHECRSCGYQYNEAAGDPSYPVPPGLPFNKLPEDWRCATCGAAQSFFVSKSVEIAGFAENQQFGLGGNTLTSGQKAVLIYGSLLLGFIFFLSGYFLQ